MVHICLGYVFHEGKAETISLEPPWSRDHDSLFIGRAQHQHIYGA